MPKPDPVIQEDAMTEEAFLSLLETQWPDVPRLRQSMFLPRLLNLLAVDAFTRNLSGKACDALREQLVFMDQHGVLNLKDRQ